MEAGSYSWYKDKDGRVLDRPKEEFDHSMDALRYGIFTRFRGRLDDIDTTGVEDVEEYIEHDDMAQFENDLY